MTDYDRTQSVGGGGRSPAESPTEVVGSARSVGGQPFRNEPHRGDQTMIAPARQPEPSFAWLVITKGRRRGDILPLKPDETTLGREGDNDIIVDDDYAGRRHAKVRVEPDVDANNEPTFFIWDLATKNGTFVDGEQIQRAKLVDGTKVQIGETVMVFKKV